ncbi:serine hydrolase domain-containing protein, partial [Escherichia coli]|uniref:serine hydrolase domain-containing protein n=1 Tax=Escherichia coli TaxID=562 RepID=UPI00398868E5
VLLSKGYGLRRIGTSDIVDEKTLFAIASNTKAFTATALAILVDEGKLQWDDHVNKYLPWFRLKDEFATREIRVRDLLCHRSG